MEWILIMPYIILGYWATGKTFYYNKIIFHKSGELFVQRIVMGAILGWALIPIAIILWIFGRRG